MLTLATVALLSIIFGNTDVPIISARKFIAPRTPHTVRTTCCMSKLCYCSLKRRGYGVLL